MGEGLRADKARDAAFLLTGAGTWVGKSAYLTANPMTIQEGKSAIAQAVLDNRVKARGPRCPWVNPLAQQPFKFTTQRISPQKMCPETMVLTTNEHPNDLPKAEGIIGDGGTNYLSHVGSLPLLQTVVSKVIEVHCQWCLQCHPDLTAQMDPDILDEVGGTEKKHT